MNLFCIHGFLGTAKDWDCLPFDMLNNVTLSTIDLFNRNEPLLTFSDWAEETFNLHLKDQQPVTLLGYSLGGRLALHLLLKYPEFFHAAVIVSTNPGLSHESEKTKRLNKDAEWARVFQEEQWNLAMEKWNSQSVFLSDDVMCERQENNYNRMRLIEALSCWSLGKQGNLKPLIEELNIPILWISGEKDIKFKEIACNMQLKHSKSQVWIAEETGHRLPWQQPKRFVEAIDTFIKSIT